MLQAAHRHAPGALFRGRGLFYAGLCLGHAQPKGSSAMQGAISQAPPVGKLTEGTASWAWCETHNWYAGRPFLGRTLPCRDARNELGRRRRMQPPLWIMTQHGHVAETVLDQVRATGAVRCVAHLRVRFDEWRGCDGGVMNGMQVGA